MSDHALFWLVGFILLVLAIVFGGDMITALLAFAFIAVPIKGFVNLLRMGGGLAIAGIAGGFMFPVIFWVAALVNPEAK